MKGIGVEAVPAYNVDRFPGPGRPFHPRRSGYLGFVAALPPSTPGLESRRLCHAGDTDHIPEMADLADMGIALLPVGGICVMTAQEAVEAARTIGPKVVVPMHAGRGIGSL